MKRNSYRFGETKPYSSTIVLSGARELVFSFCSPDMPSRDNWEFDPASGRRVLAVRIKADMGGEAGDGVPFQRVIEVPMNMF